MVINIMMSEKLMVLVDRRELQKKTVHEKVREKL